MTLDEAAFAAGGITREVPVEALRILERREKAARQAEAGRTGGG